ncbi:MAG: hypothetical protein RR657_02615 [Peptostreptococcaceae bacterium]
MSNKEVKELAKEVIREITKQQRDKRLHNTRLLMKNYNILKNHVDDVTEKLEEKIELLEEECTYNESVWIMSIARSKVRTAKMIGYVESALTIVESKFKMNCEEYKYKAFELYYIDKKTSEQIQEALSCGKNSPKVWCDLVIEELNVLLWGIDALGI